MFSDLNFPLKIAVRYKINTTRLYCVGRICQENGGKDAMYLASHRKIIFSNWLFNTTTASLSFL